jgi:hypothetical protein
MSVGVMEDYKLRDLRSSHTRVKPEPKRIYINGCRYNERLNTKTEGSKRLAYTGLHKIVAMKKTWIVFFAFPSEW